MRPAGKFPTMLNVRTVKFYNDMEKIIKETTRLMINGTLPKEEADKILLALHNVSGSFVITESAQEKLDFILGHSTTRDFPKVQPTKVWAGAVLDFLEITKLLK